MKKKIIIVSLLILILGFILPLAGQMLEIKRGNFPTACREEINKSNSSFGKYLTLYLDLDYLSASKIYAAWRTIFYIQIHHRSVNISDIINCG